jgi:hypothetical protein
VSWGGFGGEEEEGDEGGDAGEDEGDLVDDELFDFAAAAAWVAAVVDFPAEEGV